MAKKTKRCSRCGEVKTLSFFYTDKRAPDGHVTKCRGCLAAIRKQEKGEGKHSIVVRDVPCDDCDQTTYCIDNGLMCANFESWLYRGRPNDRPKIPDRHV